jgi:hypothetical protein
VHSFSISIEKFRNTNEQRKEIKKDGFSNTIFIHILKENCFITGVTNGIIKYVTLLLTEDMI